jgi:hypothetical protein
MEVLLMSAAPILFRAFCPVIGKGKRGFHPGDEDLAAICSSTRMGIWSEATKVDKVRGTFTFRISTCPW